MVIALAALAYAGEPTIAASQIVPPIESLGAGHYLDAAGHELTRDDLVTLADKTPRGRAYLRQYRGFRHAKNGLLIGGGIGLAAGVGLTIAGCGADVPGACAGGILGITLSPGALIIGGTLGAAATPMLLAGANTAGAELRGQQPPPAPESPFQTSVSITRSVNGNIISNEPDDVAVKRPPRPVTWPSIDQRLVTGQKAGRDAAVVIGLEDYAFIPDVPYAKRDATAFYDFLVYSRGIPSDRIQLVTASGKEGVEAAVTRAGQQAGAGGTVWVYFAGHGAANPSNGERMLLGDDVRSDASGFATRGVKVSDVEKLASAGGARPVLVLDTCYTGLGRGGESILGKSRFAVPQFAEKSAIPDGIEWNAASPDELSSAFDPAMHGAFTYFVLGALRGWADGELDGKKDGNVSGREADAYVRRALRSAQKLDQQPVWVGPTDPVLVRGVSETGPSF